MGILEKSGATQWHSLADTALRGLSETYTDKRVPLPYTRQWDGTVATCIGDSPRYALITLIGLAKARGMVRDNDLTPRLWSGLAEARGRWSPTPGDLGLGLWARAVSPPHDDQFTCERALTALRSHGRRCDSVELAWLLLGADYAALAGADAPTADQLAQQSKAALLGLFNSNSGLFFRHYHSGLLRAVSRRVPCFAHQIYPVMALAVHARRTGCALSRSTARTVADHLSRLQGSLGQWWWLYDAEEGGVMEGYPVYSVHQDGMAPMALLEAARVVGRSYDQEIERGLSWIFGGNEVEQSLVLPDEGLILRDVHCRGVGRVRRAARAALGCWGVRPRRALRREAFVINRECRPYHLGWLLYAAALMHGTRPTEVPSTVQSG